MEITGWIALVLVGVSLGMLGGGGSILTVPIFAYLFRIPAIQSTTYSLFLVGMTSLVGVASHARRKEVDWPIVLLFGISSSVAVAASRRLLLPWLPDPLFGADKGSALLLLLALLMTLAGLRMVAAAKDGSPRKAEPEPFKLVLAGAAVGLVAGLVGAGGGFLIVPVLILQAGRATRTAIGASLAIISAQSLIGFFSDPNLGSADWRFLWTSAAIAVAGLVVGSSLATKVQAATLRSAFGWFTLAMAVYIFAREISAIM